MAIRCKFNPLGMSPKRTITVTPIPSNATVTLSATGYSTVSGTGTRSIIVAPNVTVNFSVSYSGTTKTGSIFADRSKTFTVSLSSTAYTLTITTVPANATVIIEAEGSRRVINSVTLSSGSSYEYEVSAPNYDSATGSGTLTANTTLNVSLLDATGTLIINPTPSNATVQITANGTTTTGNSRNLIYGTAYTYSVSASNYTTTTGSGTFSGDTTLDVTLIPVNYTLTINTIPSNATVQITSGGSTTSGKTRSIPYGSSYSYTVSASGYTSKSGSGIISANASISVGLNSSSTTVSSSGTSTITLNSPATYSLIIVAGGAGGAAIDSLGSSSTCVGGGSGACFVGTLTLPAGNCVLTCGAGGAASDVSLTPLTGSATGGPGGDSTITVGGANYVVCYGGSGGTVNPRAGVRGEGGSSPEINSNANPQGTYLAGNRSSNWAITSGVSSTISHGGDGVYSENTDYGKGGNGRIMTGAANSTSGNDGYISLTMLNYI